MDIFKILRFLTVLVISSMFGAVHTVKQTNLAREVVCEGCHAIIHEANTILGSSKRGSTQVRQALQNVCQVNRLTKYEFSPPNMVKACDYWKDNYIEEVKEVLSEGKDVEDQEIKLCFVKTDVCQAVDRSHFRINKYSGPNKKKIDAALKTEEEVAATVTGETGEEVFANEEIDEEEDGEVEKKETTDGDDEVEKKKDAKSPKKEKDGKNQGNKKKGKDGKKDKTKKDGDKKKKGKKDKDNKSGKKDGQEKKKGKKNKKEEL